MRASDQFGNFGGRWRLSWWGRRGRRFLSFSWIGVAIAFVTEAFEGFIRMLIDSFLFRRPMTGTSLKEFPLQTFFVAFRAGAQAHHLWCRWHHRRILILEIFERMRVARFLWRLRMSIIIVNHFIVVGFPLLNKMRIGLFDNDVGRQGFDDHVVVVFMGANVVCAFPGDTLNAAANLSDLDLHLLAGGLNSHVGRRAGSRPGSRASAIFFLLCGIQAPSVLFQRRPRVRVLAYSGGGIDVLRKIDVSVVAPPQMAQPRQRYVHWTPMGWQAPARLRVLASSIA